MWLTQLTNVSKVFDVETEVIYKLDHYPTKRYQEITLPWPVQAIFDAGNPVASIGSTLVVTLWCAEVERLAALAPQVPLLQ